MHNSLVQLLHSFLSHVTWPKTMCLNHWPYLLVGVNLHAFTCLLAQTLPPFFWMAHIHAPRLKPYWALSISSAFVKHHTPLWPQLNFHHRSIWHMENCDHDSLSFLFLPRVLTFLFIGFLQCWNPFNHPFFMTHVWSWCVPPHRTIFPLVGQPLTSLPCHFPCLIHVISHFICHNTCHVIIMSHWCHCLLIEHLSSILQDFNALWGLS